MRSGSYFFLLFSLVSTCAIAETPDAYRERIALARDRVRAGDCWEYDLLVSPRIVIFHQYGPEFMNIMEGALKAGVCLRHSLSLITGSGIVPGAEIPIDKITPSVVEALLSAVLSSSDRTDRDAIGFSERLIEHIALSERYWDRSGKIRAIYSPYLEDCKLKVDTGTCQLIVMTPTDPKTEKPISDWNSPIRVCIHPKSTRVVEVVRLIARDHAHPHIRNLALKTLPLLGPSPKQ